jgi:hypothetical protein
MQSNPLRDTPRAPISLATASSFFFFTQPQSQLGVAVIIGKPADLTSTTGGPEAPSNERSGGGTVSQVP